jgi:PBSX family phage terminase large subunit
VGVNVLTRRYTPLGTAKELMSCREGEVLVSGPAGTGKSRACLEKLHRVALLTPGVRCLIVRKTAVSLTSTALVTFREHVARESLEVGDLTWYGGSTQEAAQYRYTNGSVIVVGGMDKAQKVMSSEYDLIYVQEATELSENDWEALTTRLRNGRISFQQLLADCNPDRPTHWLKQRCDKGMTKMLYASHKDNPTLFDGDVPTAAGASYLDKLNRLTGVRYQRLARGLWVAADGLVYDDYDPVVHLIDQFEIPDDWDRYWVIDFGFTNPFVLQWWAEDPDGRLYLYREIYMSGRLVEDHAKDALDIVMKDGVWIEPKPVAIICDHDAEDRATFTRHTKLPTTPAKKGKTKGIQLTQARFKVQKDGKPRIYFMRDAVVKRDVALGEAGKPTSTIEEITGYVWPEGKTGDQAEEPVKEDDHGMDTTRYMASHRDRSEYRVRWI